MVVSEEQLATFLVDQGLITGKALHALQEKAKRGRRSLEEVVVEEEAVDERRLTELKAYIRGIPFVDVAEMEIPSTILRIVPEDLARKRSVVSYAKRGQLLEVAMTDPDDLQTVQAIKKHTGLQVKPRLTSPSSLHEVLSRYRESLVAEVGELIGKTAPEVPIEPSGVVSFAQGVESVDGEDLQKVAQELPVIRIVDTLVRHAVLGRASDIHIEPQEREVLVRYRVDGLLQDAMALPWQAHDGILARIKVLSNLKLDEHRLPQDGRFAMEMEGQKLSFRVSVLPTFYGEKVVMRILHEDAKGLTLEGLGLEGKALEIIHRDLRRPHGMILVTGPTGSGKTTTLYTMMDILNKPDVNISTVEDPIEYQMSRINQTQVKPEIGLTFASGLRSLVRQDPDVIMVGEIRDQETAQLAINAALTGHLVLSTLHTNNAAGALPRLIDMGVEPFLIASTVNVIVAQRLVRALCAEREAYALDEAAIKAFGEALSLEETLEHLKGAGAVAHGAAWKDLKFYRPKPSKDCPDGFQGRIGIFEVLEVTDALRAMFTEKTSAEELERRAREEGMLTMVEDGIIKVLNGRTTLEEVLRVTRD